MCAAARRRWEATDGPIVSGDRAGNAPGYVLFGVLVGITLLGVGMSAAVTLWSQVVQREREAELLFRGEAVVRALERFQADRPGTLPQTLAELVEGRYLRRAWRDPMTGRAFRLLRAEDRLDSDRPAAERARPRPVPTNPAGEQEFPLAAGQAPPGEPAATAEATTGITGVVSTSDLLSFRAYQGARRYRDWRFEVRAGARVAGEPPTPERRGR